ncbi:Alpha/beta hydrolase family-domain-containing protein [Fomitopsis serialis]|uniref:Alpha/beta hydrolase family-domain-containing protein n=1 Tax=Fomitopsis serialis TaxID=139415 RepID=UPI002008E06E|nr:Alpha/beta hydrolase family-domain-containing protein [Neoantrodia serialis]KAH9918662.1 Alpha/beta hydrolase family-domain-containing protein [Neoantrodia serialis]
MPASQPLCYPRYDGQPTSNGVPIPPLLPLVPPRTFSTALYHNLPEPANVANYRRTSHLVPAASPRSLTFTSPLREDATRSERVDAKSLAKALIDAKIDFETGPAQRQYKGRSQATLWNCVDRYVRRSPPIDHRNRGITLFLTHATGSPRQIWEPTLIRLFGHAQAVSSLLIDEIWSFESVQHGDSGVLNDAELRDVFDWQDQTRDIHNFVLHYLPTHCSAASLPLHLEYIEARPEQRPIIGIGHSYGGTTLIRAAIAKPELFQRLILVEPMITPPTFTRGKGLNLLLWSALGKPSQWSSRAHAKSDLSQSRVAKAWHPDVIDIFVKHGLVGCGDARAPDTVRLKTRPFDEAVVYCEWNVCYEAWTGLKDIPPGLSLHWIMSAKSNATTGGTAMTQETVWRRAENASNVRVDAGHLIVHEAPDELARELIKALSGCPLVPLPKSQL